MTITRRHRNERIAAAIVIAVLAVLVVLFILWNRGEERALRRDVRYIPQKEAITPEILLLRDYIRIDTTTREGVARGARWLAELLTRNGLKPELIESAPGRWNVYVRVRGKQRGGGLLLANHIDVVPANPAQWAHPPFAGEIHLNQLWGRGAQDMKAIALCELFALAAVNRDGPPEHDIAFLATGEEENGSAEGMQWLLAHRPNLFEGLEYAITEGGITEVVSERSSYFGIEMGTKQRVEVVLRGEKERLAAARMALEPSMTSRERYRVLPEVRRFFRDVSVARIGMKPMLEDIDGAIARGEAWRLALPYRELMQNTLQMSAPELIDGRWRSWVLMVNLPDENPDARVAWLRDVVAPYNLSLEVTQKEGPVPSSRAGTPLAAILADEARTFYRVHAGSEILYSSLSDCRFLRARGMQCYGVSPHLTDIAQSLTIHRPDERIRLDWFMNGIEYLGRAVGRWAKQ
jgi:acetylornithine deacetylase/succinyl-diaminopimelate desuccinylase-like protein